LVTKLEGSQLKLEYFEKNGFKKPIFVENKDNLDFSLPSSNFSLNDIEQLLGSDYELEVIDVEKQKTFAMKMNLFKNYFNATRRTKIYNLISLEISKTKLNDIVTVPRIVREISWVIKISIIKINYN
jgi:lysine-specific demethylase PHF8